MSQTELNAKEKALFGKSTNPSNIEPLKLTMDSQLKFRCHPGVSCFTACCGNIKIVLTPYDILMLTRRLGIMPHEFLHTYTSPTYLEKTDMPGVMIKLREEDNKCPFVTPEGCTVYTDRPTACRYYPVGMADFREGGSKDADGNEVNPDEEKFFFLVREDHCKGHEEDKLWTVGEWRADQGVDVRDEMNKKWLRLIMRRKSFGHQANLSEQAKRMFFMASTDLHHFRRFIFESSFLKTYELDEEIIEKIKDDDVELMMFSFDYLANSLFGAQIPGMNIKEEKIKEKVEQIKQRQDEAVTSAVEEYEEMKKERNG
ncbi:MAG: YkgJ family cysteine cluster protein [Desulfofustis sp.]|nr:YkgJ family cysteine cluster protein [Desulfofustis sp.]RZW20329.1 MAG: YkgJ family cysteine cluster protein [Desulfobulbaceae bacterium]MBT8354662.1 YkgJ family cysteine cluster protein [Desulfofustis sp.]NNF47885.1 YkgJ family cysteine cluster protein [Desulfofustis sp.]NNK14507.1 YkgJ family cysteine cluster protein [Desulfofustis sp.]